MFDRTRRSLICTQRFRSFFVCWCRAQARSRAIFLMLFFNRSKRRNRNTLLIIIQDGPNLAGIIMIRRVFRLRRIIDMGGNHDPYLWHSEFLLQLADDGREGCKWGEVTMTCGPQIDLLQPPPPAIPSFASQYRPSCHTNQTLQCWAAFLSPPSAWQTDRQTDKQTDWPDRQTDYVSCGGCRSVGLSVSSSQSDNISFSRSGLYNKQWINNYTSL